MNCADIAAVVVSWDSEETLDGCLTRLRGAEGVAEIRVVDCGSTDSTLTIVQRHAVADSRFHFIANPDPPGLGAARNQGIADCRAPWLALLDAGCLIEPDALARLRDLAARYNALVGADLADESGVRDPAARLDAGRGGPAGWWRWLELAPAVATHEEVQDVAAVSGAVMVLPRVLFDTLNGFDPALATGIANLDLCRRARASGVRIACANAVRVTRVRGMLARTHPVHLIWHRRFDASRFLWRRGSKASALLAWPRIWVGFPLDLLRVLARVGSAP